MLEIKRTAVALDEQELLELARIVIDEEEKEALRFLKKAIYDKIVHAQGCKLKFH